WQMIQLSVDQLLDQVTLADLINSEQRSGQMLNAIVVQDIKT
ncbi:MAG: hypothetical protein JWP67_2088, partial [Mucilaginibacter sp.]|nr:hypothetical protein [Mucilaginibacter sp.]